jgi:hypothetical protein
MSYLRRYTNIPALVYLLNTKKITLLDPASWDDKNDSHYMTLYKNKLKLKCLLALCFAQSAETYHHWRVFAGGSSGVCIAFRRKAILEALESSESVRSGSVVYLKLDEIRDRKLKVDELPFLKRFAYEHENEYRVIYQSSKMQFAKLDVAIPLSCIASITLSPWIYPSLAEPIKVLLRSIDGCEGLNIFRSTLIGNEEWKTLGEAATLKVGSNK